MANETSEARPMKPARLQEEDDDELWIPLEGDGRSNPPSNTSTFAPSSKPNSSSSASTKDLSMIIRTLEARKSLRENLVDHPIDLLWKRFLVNLGREVWNLDLHIRLGLSLITSGFLLKMFLLSTWYFWYPRLLFGAILFIAAFIFLDPLEIKPKFEAIRLALFSPDQIVEAIERMDTPQMRRTCFVLLFIPTALEMRTISFLSQIKAESCWFYYNIVLSCVIFSIMMYLFREKHSKPRECTYAGLLLLYGSALIVTVVKTDIRRIPWLAAPFFLATGTLLLTYQNDDMEWLSRILRHALRVSLRDVLSSVSEKVGEDEMLQLAILRWIVDYWSNSPSEAAFSGAPPSSGATPTRTQAARFESHDNAPARPNFVPSEAAENGRPSRAARQRNPQRLSACLNREDVQWEELLPMLNLATEQMESEVHTLQSPKSSTTGQKHKDHSSCTSSSDGNRALHNLKSMLMSLNVDERAKPAVLAYRRAVESFPPSRNWALFISVIRRCPASLTLLWHFMMWSGSVITATIILVPFIVMEYFRILEWVALCESMVPNTQVEGSDTSLQGAGQGILANVDVMTILLSGDSHSSLRPPTLLLVWRNVESSVSALEAGLTAARCAQTTAATVQFAGNIISLVQFGFEISERGLLHGLAVMVTEAISMHGSSIPESEAKIVGAAIQAVHNGQVVARNVQALMEEGHLGPMLAPLVGVIQILSGYGWLWGHEQRPSPAPPTSSSKVEISEVDETDPLSSISGPAVQKGESRKTPKAASSSSCSPVPSGRGQCQGSNENDLSAAMDLVAEAYESGLIEEVSISACF